MYETLVNVRESIRQSLVKVLEQNERHLIIYSVTVFTIVGSLCVFLKLIINFTLAKSARKFLVYGLSEHY